MKSIIYSLFFISSLVVNAQAPSWTMATSLGGISDEIAEDVATDQQGNTYVTGWYHSDQIVLGNSTFTQSQSGSVDFLLIKLDDEGDVLWARSAVGNQMDLGQKVSLDANGNVYVIGHTMSSVIDFGSGVLNNMNTSGPGSTFICKYSNAGALIWARLFPIAYNGQPYSLVADPSGNTYFAGTYWEDTLSVGSLTMVNTSHPFSDIYLCKISPSGGVVWAQTIGGDRYENMCALSSPVNGSIYLSGAYDSDTFTVGNDTFVNGPTESNFFISNIDTAGNVNWTRSSKNAHGALIYDLKNDPLGNIFVCGDIGDNALTYDSHVLNLSPSNFIMKLDPNGNFLWSKEEEYPIKLAVDAGGNVFAAGHFLSSSISFGSITLNNEDSNSLFVVKYNSAGNAEWAKAGGGFGQLIMGGFCSDAEGHVSLTGYFSLSNLNFDTLQLSVNGTSYYGAFDLFTARLGNWPLGIGDGVESATDIVVFPNPCSFETRIETYTLLNNGSIKIIDAMGRTVQDSDGLYGRQHVLNTGLLGNGTYYLMVHQDNRLFATEKLFVVGQ